MKFSLLIHRPVVRQCLAPLTTACAVAMLTACTSTTPQPTPAQSPTVYSDPFAYCAAVGTVDAPNEQYSGPAMPEIIVQGMIQQGIVSADAPLEFQQNAVWRCMDGQVWVCHFGANLPCLERADTSREPTPAMESFCQADPAAESIPAAVTGRATVYEWRCNAGRPQVSRQVLRVDAQGYLADFWYALTPPQAAPPATATTAPLPTATPEPTPASAYAHDQVIRFDSGPLDFKAEGAVLSGQRDRYELQVVPGEMLDVWLMSLEGNAVLSILGPDGAPLPGTEEGQGVTRWTVILPAGGTHSIVVGSTGGNASYTISVHTTVPVYQALALPNCQALQADLTRAFGMRFNLIDTPFTDPFTGASGMACTLEANGTGADFGTLPQVMAQVRSVLVGWQENPSYAADSPTATATAFTRDRALLLVMASWEPRADANCSTDQPISACPLTPEQQLFSVRLQGVQY